MKLDLHPTRLLRRACAVAALCVLASACVRYAPLADDYAGPTERPLALSDDFAAASVEGASAGGSVPAQASLVASAAARERNRIGFKVRELSLPGANGGDPVPFIYYDVDDQGPTPVILLLPIYNGKPIVTRYFARYFASRGWAAVQLGRDTEPIDHLDAPEEAIRENMREYRRVLDWIAAQDELDAQRIGLFGISLGAMDAVMLTALDTRIDALVAAMAGGDLAHVLMSTSYRPIERTVANLMTETGLTRAALESAIDDRIATDPLALAPYVDAERTLMILTRTDTIVPYEAQEALRRRLGAPESLLLPTGHRTSIIYFPFMGSSAFDFFSRQFDDAPRVAER